MNIANVAGITVALALPPLAYTTMTAIVVTIAVTACGGATSTPSDGGVATVNPEGNEGLPSSPSPSAPTQPPDESGSSARWCDQQGMHSFCADFDGASVTEGWSNGLKALASGGITSSPSDRSAPTAATIAQAPGDGASLGKWLTGSSGARVALDTRVDDFGSEAHVVTGLFLSKGEDPVASVFLTASEAAVVFELVVIGGNSLHRTSLAALPRGKWTRVGLSLQQDANGNFTSSLEYDGVPMASLKYPHVTPQASPDSALLVVGPMDWPPKGNTSFRVSFDNVLADTQ